ncbi:MAG: DEAD/DEAH box helicase [Firmicutes bacterium]|nr:DEAD/DEAH box helicase [Bacillota bacterium]
MSQLYYLYVSLDCNDSLLWHPVRTPLVWEIFQGMLARKSGHSPKPLMVAGPLPMWAVWNLMAHLQQAGYRNSRRRSHWRLSRWLRREAKASLRVLGLKASVSAGSWPGRLPSIAAGDWDTTGVPTGEDLAAEVEGLVSLLYGRRLLEDEALGQIRRQGIDTSLPVPYLLELAGLLGLVRQEPGVMLSPGVQWQCSRCGSTTDLVVSPGRCPTCGAVGCRRCRACVNLGQVCACRPLYDFSRLPSGRAAQRSWASGNEEKGGKEPVLAFTLTGPQAAAYDDLVRFVTEPGAPDNCLVWAVCGAGKTEACFGAIAATLSQGKRVLFAVPRREVVLELVDRIRRAFPQRRVSLLVGGQSQVGPLGQIVVATTHQTLRFAAVFDLVVLDEADAFPYQGDPMLARALSRCFAPGAQGITMTATPSEYHWQQVHQGKWAMVVIHQRHHGQPLPVPQVWLQGNGRQSSVGSPQLFPPELEERILRRELSPLLIFVPTVVAGKTLTRYLQQRWPDLRLDLVHAGKQENRKLLEGLRSGQLDALVTTTLLSRGITIPGVNVIVAQADTETIFSCATLVQIAGRVGRTPEQPSGEVWFLAAKETKAMTAAAAMIREANARSQGALSSWVR